MFDKNIFKLSDFRQSQIIYNIFVNNIGLNQYKKEIFRMDE